MKISLVSVCDWVVRWSLLTALFLTPVFFLPWTLYAVSLNKQVLFTVLVSIAAIAWLMKAIHQGEIAYIKSPLHSLAFALVGTTALSMFFSRARTIGFMGVNGGEVDTVTAVIGFALLYFLIAGTFHNEKDTRHAFIALAVSGTFMVIHAALQLFGVWFLPWDFAQSAEFNAVGTTNALGLFLGALFVVVFGAAYYDPSWKKRVRVWLGILAAALFAMSVYIGYAPLFIGIAVAMIVMIVADMRGAGTDASRRSLAPLAIAVISLFIVGVAGGIITFNIPRAAVSAELTPRLSASWGIVKSSARESIKNVLVGSGPATYQYEYAKHRDAALNQSYFWDIRFAQGFNAFMTHLVSWGVVGTGVFMVFLAVLVREIMRWCLGRRAPPLITAVAAGSAYTVFTLFIYPHNFTLYFLLFALAGLLVGARAEDSGSRVVIDCAASSKKTVAWSLVMMLLIMGLILFIYVNGERYVGAVQFEKGVAAANVEKTSDAALPLFIAAQNYDPRNDLYLQVLGTAWLSRANTLAATSTTPTSENQNQFSIAIGAAVEAARRAVAVNPDNAVNWIGLARVYEVVIPFVDGAADAAFKAYEEARAREPNNPAIPVNAGRAHMAYAVLSKEKRDAEYALALAAFEASLVLKPDYAPAHFALVEFFNERGKTEEAIARADRLRALAPNDVGVLFQLGLLHYQGNRLGKAREMLEAALSLSPDYANALYVLGLIHDKQGEHAAALLMFERVRALNPDNAEIAALIDTLRSNRSGISGAAEPRPLEEKLPGVTEAKKQ